MSKSPLNDEARAFFAALDRVVYGNPFSEERAAVIQRLLPGEDTAHLMQDMTALIQCIILSGSHTDTSQSLSYF